MPVFHQTLRKVLREEHRPAILLIARELVVDGLENTNIVGVHAVAVRVTEYGNKFVAEDLDVDRRLRGCVFTWGNCEGRRVSGILISLEGETYIARDTRRPLSVQRRSGRPFRRV